MCETSKHGYNMQASECEPSMHGPQLIQINVNPGFCPHFCEQLYSFTAILTHTQSQTHKHTHTHVHVLLLFTLQITNANQSHCDTNCFLDRGVN